MKLGFVGVGRWAQKLASAFRACGAEIVAYDRKRGVERWSNEFMGQPHLNNVPGMEHGLNMGPDLDGFGRYLSWREQLADPSIDAIVAVAPPEVTTEVALACAAAGKAVCATKPLFDHPDTIRAPFYVDFWRLYSDFHRVWVEHREEYATADIKLEGHGPYRDFPGALDYGPHVIAQLFDAWRCYTPVLAKASKTELDGGELFWAEYHLGVVGENSQKAWVQFGNGSDFPRRCVSLSYGSHGERLSLNEDGLLIGSEEKSAVLQRFCQSFLNDISEGFVDTRLLRLSRDGMRELRKIREMATASVPTRR